MDRCRGHGRKSFFLTSHSLVADDWSQIIMTVVSVAYSGIIRSTQIRFVNNLKIVLSPLVAIN